MYAGGDERVMEGLPSVVEAVPVPFRFGGAAVGRRNRRRVKQRTPLQLVALRPHPRRSVSTPGTLKNASDGIGETGVGHTTFTKHSSTFSPVIKTGGGHPQP